MTYLSLGAMRFPQIDSMKRTFDLFKLVGLDEKHWEKYILSHENNVLFYNGMILLAFSFLSHPHNML